MPFRKSTWADWNHGDVARVFYIGIVVISAIVMAILFVLIVNDRNSLRREANIRATQIQQQRYDATFNNCVDQNKRHDKTIRRITKIVDQSIKKGEIPKSSRSEVLKQNEFLIDALAPIRNCKQVASKAVHELPPPNQENF